MPTTRYRYNVFTNNFDLTDLGGSGGGGTGGVDQWIDVTAASQAMSANTGYTANNNSVRIVFLLPLTCPYGSCIRVVGKGSQGWNITQNLGQIIHFGEKHTTVGLPGSISSNDQYDAIELLCTVADTEFTVIGGPQGNLTVD